MFVGIHHTAISTPDLERAIAFYRDRFGFAPSMDFAWDESNVGFQRTHAAQTRGRVGMLERGASGLEIFEYAKPLPRPADPKRRNVEHGLSHVCIEVKD